jgi:fumarate reductase flavoprotein subunit
MNSSKNSVEKNLQADIVIIGGGGAGLAAAIEAVVAGANNIIVLEERKVPGGNSKVAVGFFGAESPVQKRMGIYAPRDEFFKKAMSYAHWKTDPRLVRAFIDKSGDTIRWLEEKGVKFDRVTHLYRNLTPTFHLCHRARAGAQIVKVLVQSCEDLGVRLLCQIKGKKILTDERGSVTGVLAKTKDKEIRIMAKSVIIATGGCLGNKELLKKYYPSYSEKVDIWGLPVKGDGLLMAMEIGAATEGLGTLEAFGPDFRPSMDLQNIALQPNTIWVNKRGERFADESIASQHFSEGANAMLRQPEKISYTLFDQKIKQSNTEEGLPGGLTMSPEGERFVWEKSELPKLEKQFQLQVEKGRVKISDSWDDIARWIGAPLEVLKATIDEYNSFCERGHDEIFAKDKRYLIPLRTPPYYAMECHLHVYCTIGGIKINHRMEALDSQENPIPGLYATGMDAGGWEADTYNVVLAGHSLGFAVNSGRIAGENAANYVLGK